MITATTPLPLTMYFDQEFGSEGPDPEMFLGIDGELNPLYCGAGNALDYAYVYVNRLETAELQELVRTSSGDVLAFRYFRELPQPAGRSLYIDEWMRALYWTAVSITLAGLYRYVEEKRKRASS